MEQDRQAVAASKIRLVLGPLLYNWPAEKRLAYYRQIAEQAPVDEVILGDVVCAKRLPFLRETDLEAADILRRNGKAVTFSTLALPVQDRECQEVSDICALLDDGYGVEANEAGALHRLRGLPHRVGPFFNTYNEATLAVLRRNGALSACLPWELNAASVATLAKAGRGQKIATEVPVFGRIPLALSARCYHARAHGLTKDGCRYVCGEDEEGMAVETLDGQAFLRVNGTQTLSDSLLVLVSEVAALITAGVTRLRLGAEALDMATIAEVYRTLVDGTARQSVAMAQLQAAVGDRATANGYLHNLSGAAWKPKTYSPAVD